MPKLRVMLAAAVTAALVAPPVGAQGCMKRERLVADLQAYHAEALLGRGLEQSGGFLFEVFMSKDGESWTLLQTSPNGMSCIVAAGSAWLAVDPRSLASVPG